MPSDTHTDEEKLYMGDTTDSELRAIAEWLHSRYEKHAHHEGGDTQKSTKVAFDDLPEANKRTMLLMARDVVERERAAYERGWHTALRNVAAYAVKHGRLSSDELAKLNQQDGEK